jgi:uncharacterized membrane protein
MTQENTPHAIIQQVTVLRSLQWLVLGMRDLVQLRWISLAHGIVVALGGAVIAFIAYDRFWLLAGALSGFLFIAPVLAASLYTLSRDLEKKQASGWRTIWTTWSNWQLNHHDKRSNDYWCMVQFGLLLTVAATGWVLTSAALITLLSPIAIHSPLDFLRHVVGSKEGYLFEIWLALGGFLAAPIFASSVVTMPLLLDRRISLLQAILISWNVVLKNPVPMAVWAAMLMVMSLLGLCSLLIGMVAVVPLLGHASWHAYKDLVDVSQLPNREDASTTTTRSAAL